MHGGRARSIPTEAWTGHTDLLLQRCMTMTFICLLLCRQVIADAVLADPFEWNEAVLGREPADYCRWIRVSALALLGCCG